MNKTDYTKYLIICLLIGGFFYVFSMNKKVNTLEKTVTDMKNTVVDDSTTKKDDNQDNKEGKTTADIEAIKDAFNKAYIKFGSADNKLVALEISDPSCPYCNIAGGKNNELNIKSGAFKLVEDGGTYIAPAVELKKLLDQGKISFALIYMNGHNAGEMGMKALYCAYDAGKFWEANDLLMSAEGYALINEKVRNSKEASGELSKFLSSAVDENTMKECLDSGKFDQRLIDDQKLAVSLGVRGTPSFFINDFNYGGAYNYADMQSTVDKILSN